MPLEIDSLEELEENKVLKINTTVQNGFVHQKIVC